MRSNRSDFQPCYHFHTICTITTPARLRLCRIMSIHHLVLYIRYALFQCSFYVISISLLPVCLISPPHEDMMLKYESRAEVLDTYLASGPGVLCLLTHYLYSIYLCSLLTSFYCLAVLSFCAPKSILYSVYNTNSCNTDLWMNCSVARFLIPSFQQDVRVRFHSVLIVQHPFSLVWKHVPVLFLQ